MATTKKTNRTERTNCYVEIMASLRATQDNLSILSMLLEEDKCNFTDVDELYEAVGHLRERMRQIAY